MSSDGALIWLAIIFAVVLPLLWCGEPDLHDALVSRVEAR